MDTFNLRVIAGFCLLYIAGLLLVDHYRQIEHRRLLHSLSKCITQTQCTTLDAERIVLETKLMHKK